MALEVDTKWTLYASEAAPTPELWERIAVAAAGGAMAAIIAAGLGYLIATRFTERREARAAQRQRALVSAEEFYSAYGKFFAAWKSWNDFRGQSRERLRSRHVTPEQRLAFLNRVADAEGQLETFLILLTLERPLAQTDLERLWCFRRGYKQLRFHVRNDRRLPWTRTPSINDHYEQYEAFKGLTAAVAAMIVRCDPAAKAASSSAEAHKNLRFVTGAGDRIRGAYANELPPALRQARGDKLWYVLPKLIDERERAQALSGRAA